MTQNADRMSRLLQKANDLPLCPGVYIMRDVRGKVIYVGKSRKLKSRVSQYFQNSEKNAKTARMVERVHAFEYILCETEIEALCARIHALEEAVCNFPIPEDGTEDIIE